MASLDYKYSPDVVFPPGDTLQELLDARNMTQVELAQKLNMSTKGVSQLINGRVALSQQAALKLERVVGVDASFWNNLEARYREWLTREEEAEQLKHQKCFLKNFPYKEMLKRGWIPDGSSIVEKVRNLLNFFGVANPEAWQAHWGGDKLAAFRKTNAENADQYATAAWLRAGEVAAKRLQTATYDERRFLAVLDEIRAMIPNPPNDFSQRIVSLCAGAGVALVLMPQLPRTGISGATRWIHKTPIVQLTLRYRYEDFFWFALFHEAAHVLLHGRTNAFWQGLDSDDEELKAKEAQADTWARDFMIPPGIWEHFISAYHRFNSDTIRHFANQVSTAPGVVVGRLQHEKRIGYKFHNDLRRQFNWVSEN